MLNVEETRHTNKTDKAYILQVWSYAVFAASVFKWAQDQCTATIVLHMIGQVLPGDVRGAALIRTLDWETRAVVLMVL